MASESFFRTTFCGEIINAYGKEKFTNSRIQAVWNSVRNYYDEALAVALKEVTKPAMFPGADKIIELCSIAQGNFKNAEVAKAKATSECTFCSGGVRQVNGYAYKCSCKLGQLMYPNFPEYNGQVQFQEKRWEEVDKDSGITYELHETANAIYRKPKGSKNVKDFSFFHKTTPAAQPQSSFKPKLIKANSFDMEKF